MAGVILPKPALRRHVLLPRLLEGDRNVLRIHRDRARPGCIDADADDPVSGESGMFRSFRQCTSNALFQSGKVIPGILPCEMVIAGIKENSLLATGVIDDTSGQFAPVAAADNESSDAVGSVIKSEGK